MRRKRTKLWVFGVIVVASGASYAQAKLDIKEAFDVSAFCDAAPAKMPAMSDPTACLVQSTNNVLTICAMMVKLTLEESRLEAERRRLSPGEYGSPQQPPDISCIDLSLDSSDRIYRKASTVTAKQKAKNGFLKDYYAAWRSAMSGLRPTPGEVVINYNRRQAAVSSALQTQGERLKLE